MSSCDWEQFLELEQRMEDRYDLADGVFVSRASMARDDGHAHLASELCVLVRKLCIGGRLA